MSDLIRLRDLPGIAPIEALIRSGKAFNGSNNRECADAIDRVSVSLFSMTDVATWHECVEFAEPTSEAEWEQNFANVMKPFGEARPYWEAIGWDISDGRGNELACAHYFARQIIVIASNGHLLDDVIFTPDGSGVEPKDEPTDLSEQQIEGRIQRMVDEYMKGRKS